MHKNAANLLIHIVAVPLFVLGHVLIVAAFFIDMRLAIASPVCIFVSLLMQNIGHRLEHQRVHPFLGPGDFVRRITPSNSAISGASCFPAAGSRR